MSGRAVRAPRTAEAKTIEAPSAPHDLSAEETVLLSRIITAMSDRGLPAEFLVRLDEHARASRPVFRMASVWLGESDGPERDETIVHLQEMLDELADQPTSAPKVTFETLAERVLPSVLEHKKRLRDLIDRHGGVSEVARRAGIPQPSLSRLLNDASRPRRATLYKIARALDVEESEIVGEWAR
jgi:DNA-binding phage protein